MRTPRKCYLDELHDPEPKLWKGEMAKTKSKRSLWKKDFVTSQTFKICWNGFIWDSCFSEHCQNKQTPPPKSDNSAAPYGARCHRHSNDTQHILYICTASVTPIFKSPEVSGGISPDSWEVPRDNLGVRVKDGWAEVCCLAYGIPSYQNGTTRTEQLETYNTELTNTSWLLHSMRHTL